MIDFIYKLYEDDKFVPIFSVVLVILIVAFLLVYFLGKRDKVIQETKKLQKLNVDAFKENEGEEVKAEVPVKVDVNESVPVINEEKIEEKPLTFEDATMSVFEPKEDESVSFEEVKEETPVYHKPLFSDHEEEESPINLNELPLLSDEDKKMENGLNTLESIKSQFDKIEIPEVEKEDEVKMTESEKVYKPSPQIFSSVYVNKIDDSNEKEVKNDAFDSNTNDKNDDVSDDFGTKLFTIEDDDDDIELPSLKNDNKPLFDETIGETYEIK